MALFFACDHGVKQEFDLSNIPSDWVNLTKTDSGLIVFNSCDMGNQLIKLAKNQTNYELLLHGTQEDYDFQVLSTTLLEKDTILINAQWKGSDMKQDFKFVWMDEPKGIGNWITTYESGYKSDEIFVTEEKEINFPTFDQPNVECWGEEEGDEDEE